MIPSFLNALFLAGLAGAALPLIIHLLNRDKPRRVNFGWFRFLAAAHRAQARRFKLRQLLVLLLRMLICALLALAFARPFFADATAEAAMPRLPDYIAIVADVSYSMRAGNSFERAKTRMVEILDERVDPGDQVALLTAANGVHTLLEWTDQLDLVRRAVRQLEPTYETADLGAAFRTAEQMLRRVAADATELYIVSDHQQVAWRRLDRGDRAARGVAVALEDVRNSTPDNVVITDVLPVADQGDSAGVALVVRLRRFGGDDGVVSLQLAVEDAVVASRELEVRGPNGKTDVRFDLPAGNSRRVIRGWVQLTRGDGLAHMADADTRRYFVVRPERRFRVLCVDGSGSGSGPGRATYFLQRALSPWLDDRGQVATPAVMRPGSLTAEAVSDRDVVFLCNVSSLSAASEAALNEFVRGGGGLVVCAGPRGAPALRSLLEHGTYTAMREVSEKEGYALFTDLDFAHPLFAPFQMSRHGDFGTAQTYAYGLLAEPEGARVLMRFDDGSPALVEHQLDRGRILLFATSLDVSWTDLPKRALYPAFVHQIVRYLATDTSPDGETAADYTIGDQISTTQGRATVPGIYTIDSPSGPRAVAINVDWLEGDLRGTDLNALLERLKPLDKETEEETEVADEVTPEQFSEMKNEQREREQGIWWYVMIGVMGLAVGEMLLANRS